MLRTRVAGLVAIGLLLGGCGPSVPLGTAMVVNGTDVSISEVNELSSYVCAQTVVAQGGGFVGAYDVAPSALQIAEVGVVAADIVAERGLTVPDSTSVDADPNFQQLLAGADGNEASVRKGYEATLTVMANLEAIGADEAGDASLPASVLQQIGAQVVGAEVQKADITFDPRFDPNGDGGSLSVLDKTAEWSYTPNAALACS